jgi:hypothetical protein
MAEEENLSETLENINDDVKLRQEEQKLRHYLEMAKLRKEGEAMKPSRLRRERK